MDEARKESKKLKIAISGASGFIGHELVAFLREKGHEVVRLVRKRATDAEDEICFDPVINHLETKALENTDVLINLSGKNIASERWSSSVKNELKESRVKTTSLLSHSFARLKNPPKLFLSASAVGYYGNRGDDVLEESDKAGHGFLSQLCREWELATWEAEAIGTTVNHLRFGIVLGAKGGILEEIRPMFKKGLGAVLGNGKQYMSWITISDLVRAIMFVIENPQPSGAINMVAPTPVTNREFTKALASALRRPANFRAPHFMLRLLKGEMADTLMLDSTRAAPKRLLDAGFEFQDTEIKAALKSIVG